MGYSIFSQYYNTDVVSDSYLDVWTERTVPQRVDDREFEINAIYNLRPDLLASDLYGDSRLWWVFAERNPNTLKDPLGDFVTGTKIFLPQKSLLFSALGL
jgi:hypothetical protein